MQLKKCKHSGCTFYPKVGCDGYCTEHQTESPMYEYNQKKRERLDQEKKNRAAAKKIGQKLRATDNPKNKNQTTVLQDKVEKEKWFRLVREKLTGWCQCGCGEKSQKKDDKFFRHSCCHIFPKAKFHSVKYHSENFVERTFWGGHHSVFDDTSIDRWVNMADWDNIKRKFHILEPLLTDEEKTYKFYTQLKTLVENN